MNTLSYILEKLQYTTIIGAPDHKVRQIVFDSRAVQAGDLFVAVKGTQSDGHAYISRALDAGATVIIAETVPTQPLQPDITWVQVPDSAVALSWAAARFYDEPSTQLQVVGVTGTNGKTTTATLLYKLFTALGYKVGLLSTVENRIHQTILPATHTTPNSVMLQALLRDMVEAGCQYVFMEISSHALHQQRVASLQLAGAIFTNLTHDHLDYHPTFQHYRDTKKQLFDTLPPTAFALTNTDDRNGRYMLQNTRAQRYTYSLQSLADFRLKILDNALTGLHIHIADTEVYTRLIGEFNAYNLLAVYAAARLLGVTNEEVLPVISTLTSAEGRFDYVHQPDKNIIGIVDYAHTPDALLKILQTLRQLKPPAARLITVVGCGGDRDTAKRPVMAKTAADLSEQLILTSDNPRSEDPQTILKDMEAGLRPTDLSKTLVIPDRKVAIQTACRLARTGDLILVAGKGHEKYQEINGIRHPFDDKQYLLQFLAD